ncbi:hypothetical protein M3Y94_00648300 [Aphelenchoides besseyi]|nr:hypothetical protein M3Y94_00648300 [Aphelenchoides besseyi]KAI6231096.1 hypothetical protein M3Y95_00345200 [Aphelenchoides besseyi]
MNLILLLVLSVLVFAVEVAGRQATNQFCDADGIPIPTQQKQPATKPHQQPNKQQPSKQTPKKPQPKKPQPKKTACRDQNRNCKVHQKMCTMKRYQKAMHSACSKTCGSCHG